MHGTNENRAGGYLIVRKEDGQASPGKGHSISASDMRLDGMHKIALRWWSDEIYSVLHPVR